MTAEGQTGASLDNPTSLDLREALRMWLDAEQPRRLAAWHVLTTGNGACFVDRWPEPRGALAVTVDNYVLLGDPDAFTPAQLRAEVSGFVEASEAFEPLLREAFPDAVVWQRVNFVHDVAASAAARADVRRLTAADAFHLWSLSPESTWIAKTWGGAPGLAASNMAFGAFADGRLVSVASSFFVAEGFEDIGVVTLPGYRGRGLSAACAAALCVDIHARGRRPTWGTSPDNTASLRVAEKLGFSPSHRDRWWVVGRDVPAPADPASAA
jgi:RimJ/RimL family protein N-acetyltransferase